MRNQTMPKGLLGKAKDAIRGRSAQIDRAVEGSISKNSAKRHNYKSGGKNAPKMNKPKKKKIYKKGNSYSDRY